MTQLRRGDLVVLDRLSGESFLRVVEGSVGRWSARPLKHDTPVLVLRRFSAALDHEMLHWGDVEVLLPSGTRGWVNEHRLTALQLVATRG